MLFGVLRVFLGACVFVVLCGEGLLGWFKWGVGGFGFGVVGLLCCGFEFVGVCVVLFCGVYSPIGWFFCHSVWVCLIMASLLSFSETSMMALSISYFTRRAISLVLRG